MRCSECGAVMVFDEEGGKPIPEQMAADLAAMGMEPPKGVWTCPECGCTMSKCLAGLAEPLPPRRTA